MTVETILEAATYILVERGYDALTTNRVAQRAGVNIATLYQYFPNKQAIFAELMRRHVAETRAKAFEVLVAQHGRGLEAAVRALIEAGIATHKITPALHRIFTEEGPRLGIEPIHAPFDTDLANEARAWVSRVSPTLPDPELSLWIVRTTIHALIHQALLDRPADLDRPEFLDELTRLVTRYLRSRV